MSYSFPIKQGQGASVVIPTRFDLTAYTLTVEFSQYESFQTVVETIDATSVNQEVHFEVSPSLAASLGDIYYRVKAVRNTTGKHFYVTDGEILYIKTPATPGNGSGEPGDKGPTGDRGPVGNKGATGDKGPNGDQGPVGNKGPDGDKGLKGDTGDKGPTGDPGAGGGGSSGPSTGVNALTGYYHLSGYSGVDKTGASDQTALLQSVIDAASAAGGGTVWIDPGTYRFNGTVKPKSKVNVKGAHRSLVTLMCYQVDSAMFRALPASEGTSSANPLRDITFSGFKIDANNQTLSGSYTSAVKGFYIQHMRRVQFLDLWLDGTGASSIGVDFLYEACVVDNCLITNYGRLNAAGTGPGSSGVGLGTASTTNIEPFTVTRCHVVGGSGSRYGIFVESQNEGGTNQFSQSTYGGRITDNYIQGGQYGIGDAGNRNLLIAHNQITGAVNAGIAVNGGTFTAGRTGFDGEISDNQLWANKVGIYLDYAKVGTISYTGHYTVRDNHITGSTDNGILIEMRLVTLNGLNIIGNVVTSSNKAGVLIQYSGTSPTAVLQRSVIDNNIIYANGLTGTSGNNDGIKITVPLADTEITNNKVYDHQATKTQRYGLVISTTITGGKIVDNDLRGNLTGAALFTTAPTGVHVAGNNGYNTPAPLSLTPGASPWTYSAPDYPTVLYINGGTVSALTVGGVQLNPASSMVLLEPNDSVVMTYSVAPTVFNRAR